MTHQTAASSTSTCERCGGSVASHALFCRSCGLPRARVEDDALLGRVIGGRYLLKQQLGHGAAGVIYLAEHVTVKRRVAVKVVHRELANDELAIERFRREATTVAEVDNDHLVEVLDFGRLGDGRLFLAMELLEGETLAAVVRREKQLPIAQCLDVVAQAAEGLVEAHAMGYIHRDLRPSNLFLARRRGRNGFVKILDFGLAKLVEGGEAKAASTHLGMTFGDPCYMSPEQARGDGADLRSDLYTLGIVAYEMLTGAPPFVARKVSELLRMQSEQPPAPPSQRRADVPGWLDALVLRALAKRPEDRFATASALIEAIRAGQARGAVLDVEDAPEATSEPAAPAPTPTARMPRASRRKLYLALGVLAGAAVALAAVAFLAIPGRERTGAAAAPAPIAAARAAPAPVAAPPPPAPAPAPAPARARTRVAKRAALPGKATSKPKEPYRKAKEAPEVIEIQPDTVSTADADTAAPRPAVMERSEAEFYVKLGQRALREGDLDAAKEQLEKARSLDGSNAEALAGLGKVKAMQDRAAAAAALRRALEVPPADDEASEGAGEAEADEEE